MKKRIVYVIGAILVLGLSKQAEAQQSPGVQLANHIADKMKDTLGLTTPKRNQVFAINMYLQNKKMIIRQQTPNPDTLRIKLQREEKKRDSMYQVILPPAKYQLYLQKKTNLVTSN
ncbi:MAG: hypothetical protein U0U70_15495 [Chitinophagaceae bacterium]